MISELIENLLRELNNLGDSAAIAQFLLKEKCFGFRIKSRDCPLAQFLISHGCPSVYVAMTEITWFDSVGNLCQARVPPNVRQFIVKFDMCEFPELDASLLEHNCI